MADRETSIVVRVQPNASRNEVLGFEDNVLRIRIAAPPVNGKANRELIAFLSDTLGVRKDSLSIEQGITRKEEAYSCYRVNANPGHRTHNLKYL